MNFNLTDRQALKMAKAICGNGFFVAGDGCFDISIEETAELIKRSFSTSRKEKVRDYYNQLEKEMHR